MKHAESIARGQVEKSAAEVYEEFFVPALFAPWAKPVADASTAARGHRVLDVACGTGVLTTELASRVSPTGVVYGLDINEGMLDVARRRPADIEWRLGDVESLPFSADEFDVVTCQFGLMFFGDRRRAIEEMCRVLRRDGTLAVAVWDTIDNTPGYAAAAAMLERLFGADIAESIRAPYALGDPKGLARLFEGVEGLVDIETRTHIDSARFPSIDDWMHTDVNGWTLAGMLDDSQYQVLLDAARLELTGFTAEDGRVRFPAPAHIVTARAR